MVTLVTAPKGLLIRCRIRPWGFLCRKTMAHGVLVGEAGAVEVVAAAGKPELHGGNILTRGRHSGCQQMVTSELNTRKQCSVTRSQKRCPAPVVLVLLETAGRWVHGLPLISASHVSARQTLSARSPGRRLEAPAQGHAAPAESGRLHHDDYGPPLVRPGVETPFESECNPSEMPRDRRTADPAPVGRKPATADYRAGS